MLLAQTDDVLLPDKRLAAGVDVHVDSELFPLTDEIVDLLEGEVQLVAVLCRPASGAVKIAGGSGIQQHRPWDVAVVLLTQILLDLPSLQVDVEEEVVDDGFDDIALHIKQHMSDIRVIRMLRISDGILDRLNLAGEMTAGKLVNGFHDLHHILFRILVDEVYRLTQTEFSKTFFDIHTYAPNTNILWHLS